MGSQRIDIHTHAMPRDPLGALGLTRPSRVMVVMAAVVGFTHLLAGFDNSALARAVTALLGCPYTSRQASYDLRRLKCKAIIVRLPGHHRYQLTAGSARRGAGYRHPWQPAR